MDNSNLNGIKNDILRNLILDIDYLPPGAPLSLAVETVVKNNPTYECFLSEGPTWRTTNFVIMFHWFDGTKYSLVLDVAPQTISALIATCKKALNSHKPEKYIFPHPISGA